MSQGVPNVLTQIDALYAANFPYQRSVVFGAFTTPGVAKIRPPNSPRNWNIQQGWGYSGAVVVYTGSGLAEFDVDVFLWLASQFLEWQIFANGALAKPVPPLGVGAAMQVQHPILNMAPWNIKSVVVKDVTGFERSPGGIYVATIKCLEYRQPVPGVARPIAAIAAAPSTPEANSRNAEIAMSQITAQTQEMADVAAQIVMAQAKLP